MLEDCRPVVVLVAHDIHYEGGMERACAELIRLASPAVRFWVVASSLDPSLEAKVEKWIRVRVPQRPFPLKFGLFFCMSALPAYAV